MFPLERHPSCFEIPDPLTPKPNQSPNNLFDFPTKKNSEVKNFFTVKRQAKIAQTGPGVGGAAALIFTGKSRLSGMGLMGTLG